MQRTIENGLGYRGVRLDIYAIDADGVTYNIEMQVRNYNDLPKRMRLYQGVMDATAMKKRTRFNDLPKCYVIFLCGFDFFGRGFARYTFENYCNEDKELAFGDDAVKVVINYRGMTEDEKLQSFLKFIDKKQVADDAFVKEVEQRIRLVKADARTRRGFLMYNAKLVSDCAELYDEGMAVGMAAGRDEGRAEENVRVFCENVKRMFSAGVDAGTIARFLGSTIEKVNSVLTGVADDSFEKSPGLYRS